MTKEAAHDPPRVRKDGSIFSWQGWRLELPARLNPIKLEGDYAAGYALLADLHRPRLGLRWRTIKPGKSNVPAAVQKALRGEVGLLASEEAHDLPLGAEYLTPSRLYVDPKPPGRDVWVGFGARSNRLIEIVHHARRRERMLEMAILPALSDADPADPKRWSVFDLSCIADAGMTLASQRLNAGDLSLAFHRGRQTLIVRQIAVAQLALQRMPLDKWLITQERGQRRFYRPLGEITEINVQRAHGPSLPGVSRTMRRRRRFGWLPWIGRQMATFALHDVRRDKLLLVQGTSEDSVRNAAATIGWASESADTREESK